MTARRSADLPIYDRSTVGRFRSTSNPGLTVVGHIERSTLGKPLALTNVGQLLFVAQVIIDS